MMITDIISLLQKTFKLRLCAQKCKISLAKVDDVYGFYLSYTIAEIKSENATNKFRSTIEGRFSKCMKCVNQLSF